MSGRPHRADMPELEQMRQLRRELHEAAQDARAAARELDAARGRYGGSASRHYKRLMAEHDQIFRADIEAMTKAAREAEQVIYAQLAKLVGAERSQTVIELLALMIIDPVTDRIEKVASRAVNVKAFREAARQEIAEALERRDKNKQGNARTVRDQLAFDVGPGETQTIEVDLVSGSLRIADSGVPAAFKPVGDGLVKMARRRQQERLRFSLDRGSRYLNAGAGMAGLYHFFKLFFRRAVTCIFQIEATCNLPQFELESVL